MPSDDPRQPGPESDHGSASGPGSQAGPLGDRALPGARGVRQLHARPVEWLRGDGPDSDVVVSSRVRLARNLVGFPFVNRADRTSRLAVLDAVRHRILKAGLFEPAGESEGRRLAEPRSSLWVDVHESSLLERQLLAERHVISRPHAAGKCGPKELRGDDGTSEPRGVAVSVPDERLSVMANEEDHVRIQAIRSGFALEDAFAEADALDDRMEQELDFAFGPRFGYLTACPTNVGTGVRLSVMLHLPGLRITGEIQKVKTAARDMGLAVRGAFGEGSEALGDLYQLSNQTTLGKTERTLMRELTGEILPAVIRYERSSRGMLLERRRAFLEDLCHRALGLLRHARLLSSEEAMRELSLIRLGAVTGLLPEPLGAKALGMFLTVQPAHLQHAAGEAMSQDQRRQARAAICRERLGG